jgi:acetyl-CoA carboxylase carboxyltransferase component
MPATVNLVADRLGVDGIPTFQLQAGCSGAVQALEVACHFLAASEHRTALVIGGDTTAKHLDTNLDIASLPPAQLHPYYAAERGLVDDVIDPRETRQVLIRSLRMLQAKHTGGGLLGSVKLNSVRHEAL